MRTRTRLTTPPGQEPAEELDDRRSREEHYTRGLELPTEPEVPNRWRGPLMAVAATILVVGLSYAGFRLSTVGQYEDPALSDLPTQQAPQDELPGETPEDAPTGDGTGG